jgi:hypothetical protein
MKYTLPFEIKENVDKEASSAQGVREKLIDQEISGPGNLSHKLLCNHCKPLNSLNLSKQGTKLSNSYDITSNFSIGF